MDKKLIKNPTAKIGIQRRICVGPAQKGLMQKFIKTRAKSLTDMNNNLDDKSTPITPDALSMNKGSPIESSDDKQLIYHQSIYSPRPSQIPINRSESIERDENGKPIRRGYIPAEEKIQKEINDMKNRESELREYRRSSSLSSQPDLVASINNNNISQLEDSIIDEFGQNEINYAISIPTLSDSIDSVFSGLSEATSPNSSFNYYQIHQLPKRRSLPSQVSSENLFKGNDLRPDEDKQISLRKLIAKWENIIKENSSK